MIEDLKREVAGKDIGVQVGIKMVKEAMRGKGTMIVGAGIRIGTTTVIVGMIEIATGIMIVSAPEVTESHALGQGSALGIMIDTGGTIGTRALLLSTCVLLLGIC